MSLDPADPRCPDCDGPVGQTSTYCMHCGADFDGPAGGEVDDGFDRRDDEFERGVTRTEPTTTGERDGGLLDPDGLLDNTLTVVVGVVAGLIVGLVSVFVLVFVTASGWGLLLGLLAWIGVTVHLVRQPSIGDAVAYGGYALGAVLLSVPIIALSPVVDVDGGLSGRLTAGGILLVVVAAPAGIAVVIGWAASRFAGVGSSDE
ncbi:hypothetical protein [Natronobeatus ordinarius]|uniref:hypothetical protein n=1 Tax=Natronobeatus ordinarius TaxID=2963433 RepID=UPI0020CF7788|nr:hypothetical protein [Natronobeatus ordinarius]